MVQVNVPRRPRQRNALNLKCQAALEDEAVRVPRLREALKKALHGVILKQLIEGAIFTSSSIEQACSNPLAPSTPTMTALQTAWAMVLGKRRSMDSRCLTCLLTLLWPARGWWWSKCSSLGLHLVVRKCLPSLCSSTHRIECSGLRDTLSREVIWRHLQENLGASLAICMDFFRS